MTISVVIPTYNSAGTIRQTLDSVFAQSRPADEIIAVDDSSSDATIEILESYGDRVRIVKRSANAGCADIPRYEGVRAATSEWVALLDADDLWDPDKLQVMEEAILGNPAPSLWHHYVRVIDKDGQGMRVRHEGAIPPTGMIGRALLERCFICTSAVVVRREAWLRAQTPDQIAGFGTEWDFFLAIAREQPVGFVDRVLGSYRYTTTSISRKNWKRYSRDVIGMKRVYRKGLWQGIVSRTGMKTIMTQAMCEDADLHRYDGHPGRSLWFCLNGIRIKPLDPELWLGLAKALVRVLVKR